MKNIFVVYDTNTCETVRACATMEKAIAVAIRRLVFFGHDCLSFNYDSITTVIEYRDRETHTMQALTINKTTFDEEE
jgi:hypothetical protein